MQSNRAPLGFPGSPLPQLTSFAPQIFLSSGVWKHPKPGTPIDFVCIVGGGGGGGGGGWNAAADQEAGGGGGSGDVTIVEATLKTDALVTIGAGGAGGAVNTNGTSGGATFFGALTASGGSYGFSGNNGGHGGNGGAGGGGGGGRVNTPSAGNGGNGSRFDGGGGGGGYISSPGTSTTTAFPVPTGGTGVAPYTGGYPNGGSTIASGVSQGGGGGDLTRFMPMLMGFGNGGRGGNTNTPGSPGQPGIVLIMRKQYL